MADGSQCSNGVSVINVFILLHRTLHYLLVPWIYGRHKQNFINLPDFLAFDLTHSFVVSLSHTDVVDML